MESGEGIESQNSIGVRRIVVYLVESGEGIERFVPSRGRGSVTVTVVLDYVESGEGIERHGLQDLPSVRQRVESGEGIESSLRRLHSRPNRMPSGIR